MERENHNYYTSLKSATYPAKIMIFFNIRVQHIDKKPQKE